MDQQLYSLSGSASNAVYLKLKQQIINLELPPGTALSEKDTALIFGVSRTPVRESFVRLAQEDLVIVLPQRGTRVSLINSEMVEEARFIREQLERAVIRLACSSFPEDRMAELEHNLSRQQTCIEEKDGHTMFELDEAFHRIWFEGCRKQVAWSVIQQMNAHLNRSRVLWLSTDPHWGVLYEQHRQLFEAVQAGDAERADQLMQEHLHLSATNLAVLQEKFPSYFISM